MVSEVNGILVAAHELKAPLCLLRQLALSLEFAADADAVNRIGSRMLGVSERALRQVNDLAKIARLEDGLFTMEPVGVRGVCDAVWRELTPLFRYEHRGLKLRYTNRARLAIANHDLLYSIIYNFCTNAARYSDTETESTLFISDCHGKIRIGVRDFGPALPTKVWHSLQTGALDAPIPVAMRPDSSGLGLYIASQFAKYMHAELGAIRHRDGASFFLDLPISQQTSLFA